jgi:hypothetical protein
MPGWLGTWAHLLVILVLTLIWKCHLKFRMALNLDYSNTIKDGNKWRTFGAGEKSVSKQICTTTI